MAGNRGDSIMGVDKAQAEVWLGCTDTIIETPPIGFNTHYTCNLEGKTKDEEGPRTN